MLECEEHVVKFLRQRCAVEELHRVHSSLITQN